MFENFIQLKLQNQFLMKKNPASKVSKLQLESKNQMTRSKRLQKTAKSVETRNKELGLTSKPFMSDLKDQSKKEYAPNGISPGHVRREDILALLKDLINKSNIDKEIKIADIDRATYTLMDSITSLITAKSPGIIQAIVNNNFQDLPFKEKLVRSELLVQKWSQYIDEIQFQMQHSQLPIFQEDDDNSLEALFNNSSEDNWTLNDDCPPLGWLSSQAFSYDF